MLDAFIIEEIKRREEEERRREEERRPSLPVPERDWPASPEQNGEDGAGERGVIIIDYSIG